MVVFYRAPFGGDRRRVVADPATGRAACALLLVLALGGAAACKQQKKSASRAQPTFSPSPSLPPNSRLPNASESDGYGSAPFVGQAEMRPFADLAPQSGQSMPRQMNEVGELIYGFDLPFDDYLLDPQVRARSAAEIAAEQCINEWLAGLNIVADNTKPNGVGVEEPSREVFEACMRGKQAVTGTETKANFWYNVAFKCDSQGQPNAPYQGQPNGIYQGQTPGPYQGQPNGPYQGQGPEQSQTAIVGTRIVSPNFSKGYCEQGQNAQMRYNVRIEVVQTGADQKVVRLYRRTKALTNRSGGDCEWNWDQARRVKVFSDCVYLDRVDASDTATHRFVMVNFDRVEGQQSLSGGFQYTGGIATVQYNDFQGSITFTPNGAPTWALTKAGNKNQVRGTLAIPQGHGQPPGSFPGGGGGQFPGGGFSYVPIMGPNGTREIGCEPSVVPQNFEIGGGEGNGVVSLWRTESGDSVYHAGYVHPPDRSDARTSFIARVRGNQLIWCRSYIVQPAPGSLSEGVFIGDVGGGQFYAAFVTRANLYVPVGNPVYQPNRPAQDSPAVYIAKLDPNTGNVSNATWFDIFSAPSGAFGTVVLDSQGLGQGFLRLRAVVTQAKPAGCPNVGTGTYGIVLRSDLSGLASQQAESCPMQGQF